MIFNFVFLTLGYFYLVLMGLISLKSGVSLVSHDALFVWQLFERELRRWAGQEKHMSLSSHALYDSIQVSNINTQHTLTILCYLYIRFNINHCILIVKCTL